MLRDLDGGSIELELVGWQFPNASDLFDRSWIVVSAAVSCPRGTWNFRDPCLMDSEVAELAGWLRGCGRHVLAAGATLDFTEPNLAFELASDSPDRSVLRVSFSHEALPPFARPYADSAPDEPFVAECVDFAVTSAALFAAADELETELRTCL